MQIKTVKPVVLVVLDGWGIAPAGPGNAISQARKPNWDHYFNGYPHTHLEASGEAVGLPKGEAGNSEVGHLNLGAGRIVYQELPRINQAIADGAFLDNAAFKAAVNHVQTNHSSLHLMGLLGTGVVHSSVDHLYALLWLAKEQKIESLFLHLFTDGRDSSPTSAIQLVQELQAKIDQLQIGKIATLMGRYWAMDRDNHWDRIQKAYLALTSREGAKTQSLTQAIQDSYQKNKTDEFIEPIVQGEEGAIKDSDAVLFFNFRPDRARELTKTFVLPELENFTARKKLKNLFFVSMIEYEKGLPVSAVAFPDVKVSSPLATVISSMNMRQLHIGETEKYAHVTYFFNGNHEDPYPEEDRVHIPSAKIATYDLKPEMSAPEITAHVTQKLREGMYDFYMINFANPDMVAHTGSLPATIKAIEAVDTCLGNIVNVAMLMEGAVVVTSDHGNAEVMLDPITGEIDTEHSTNHVPFVVISKQFEDLANKQLLAGILGDVAPSVLSLLGINKPSSMTGRNLLAQY